MSADRLDRDQLGLVLAHTWAHRSTCRRKKVGCVLWDFEGRELGTGYNGVAAGQLHCLTTACPGAGLPSGTGLDLCEAIHAEANALIRCRDIDLIHTAFVTHSPCIHCVKLLMNTGCERIVFAHPYAHDEPAKKLWLGGKKGARRSWEHVPLRYTLAEVI